jgi:hypothetical protein
MKNPFEEYLTEKTAISAGLKGRVMVERFGRNVAQGLSGGRGGIGMDIGKAIRGAGLAGGVTLAGLAAQKVVDAMTKATDFKEMLAYDPELASMHEENPQVVNQMFSTLRTMNPAFTKGPVVASDYVKRMVSDPEHAAGQATEALQHRDQMRPFGPIGQMVMGKAMGGGPKKK